MVVGVGVGVWGGCLAFVSTQHLSIDWMDGWMGRGILRYRCARTSSQEKTPCFIVISPRYSL